VSVRKAPVPGRQLPAILKGYFPSLLDDVFLNCVQKKTTKNKTKQKNNNKNTCP
jgi:hypothetical protein